MPNQWSRPSPVQGQAKHSVSVQYDVFPGRETMFTAKTTRHDETTV